MKKFLVCCGLVLGSALSSWAQKSNNHNFEITRNLEVFNDIYKQLDLFYVDTLSADTVIRWGIDAMLRRVDPFTVYYADDNMDDLRTMATGKYAGIGSYIRYHKKEKRTVISEPYEGSPAQQAGVKAGDIILSVDDKEVEGMSVDKVSDMLRGVPGTELVLKVARYGEPESLTFRIIRRNIQMPQVPYYGEVRPGVGYIYLTGFTEGAAREIRHALTELQQQGIKSLVLDLRSNPGGSLDEAVEIASLFIPKGSKVVYTKGKLGSANRTYYTTKDPLDTEMPLVVLVNGGTASSAEIVSGTLQDYDRAVIMGQRTYGKGFVQMIKEVPYRGSLKITTSRYYIPSGRCIQAYDYRHLNADGSVGTVPDSLTHIFYTKAGREVRDGGGIKPDVALQPDSLPSMIYDLVANDVFFDYVNRFVAAHKTIAPAGAFDISDADYADFVAHVEASGFTYNRRSVDILKLLKDMAVREGYYDDTQEEFEALSAKFSTHLAKDLERFKKDIKVFLNDEIVRRYYYQRGGVIQQLKEDEEVAKAVEIISDPSAYRAVLSKETGNEKE